MWLRVAAKLELGGFVLLFPGSSRVTHRANAVGLLSNGMHESLYDERGCDLPVCRCCDQIRDV